MEEIIRLENIDKVFPGVQALTNINLSFYTGEIHAVTGENGAGKSTLMKIIAGIYKADGGQMYFKGEETAFKSAREALENGISMIHQELMPILNMTVAENIFLGREPISRARTLNRRELNANTRVMLAKVNLDVSPLTKLSRLSTSKMQLVEIAKAISFKSNVLIMDEPTSSLTKSETKILFDIMKQLKQEGVSIIYISHKLDEIFEIADKVSVFRDSEFIATHDTKDITEINLIKEMVGREFTTESRRVPHDVGDVVMEVKGLKVPEILYDISFELRKGELLGFAGLMGAGRTETAEAIFGARKKSGGDVFINHKKVKIKQPFMAVKNGIAFLTEDRKLTGLNLIGTVLENCSLVSLEKYSKIIINRKAELKDVKKMVKTLNIKTPSLKQKIKNLSGGNQQKVVLAKWLIKNSNIVIMDEPTRGIDVGAKSEIYKLIMNLVKEGKAVIMISSEMEEIITLSDRVLVFNNGHITGNLTGNDINQEKIMELASKKIQ